MTDSDMRITHDDIDTPPTQRVDALIRRAKRVQDAQCEKIERALEDAHEARSITRGFRWRQNFIIALLGATFVEVGALLIWTVLRVDQVEARVLEAATKDARRVAVDVTREELRATR